MTSEQRTANSGQFPDIDAVLARADALERASADLLAKAQETARKLDAANNRQSAAASIQCPKCGETIKPVFYIGGTATRENPTVIDLSPTATFGCDAYQVWEEWKFTVVTAPKIEGLEIPKACPSCKKPIDSIGIGFSVPDDDGLGPTMMCPECNDEICYAVGWTIFHAGSYTMHSPRRCKSCGCTDDNACVDADGEACAWCEDEPDLCTACMSKQNQAAEAAEEAHETL